MTGISRFLDVVSANLHSLEKPATFLKRRRARRVFFTEDMCVNTRIYSLHIFITLDIPILRQVFGFALLTVLPGFLTS
jgi:hypothetical protein